mmetsp:Transcript_42514/g.92388  ORF Transcript_42514/g.92388 Transcript_42514/m.92388 type:complete len:292 (-) Transcript_42514:11-886(-)
MTSATATASPWRCLRLRLAGDDRDFQVLLYDGCCSDALQKAVAARVAALPETVYCTLTPEADGPVLPLSAALAAQLSESQVLTVHISRPMVPPVEAAPFAANSRQSEAAAAMEVQSNASSTQLENVAMSPTNPMHKVNSTGLLQSGSYVSYLRMNRVRWENFTQQTDQLVTAMERFNRLATDLANERTLLAWLRTAMAGIRTIFVFYAMDGVNKFWETSITASEVLMAILVLVLLYTGQARYYAIKELILRKDPPPTFGRISLRYTYLVLALATFTTVMGVCLRRWQKLAD